MPRENGIASRPPLHPQFGLRSLFAAMTVCCLVLGTSHWLGPVAAIALAFVLLMVALHVAGNALGTRMRGGSPHRDGQSFAVGRPRGPTFAGSPVQAHPPHQPHHLAKGDRPSLHIFAFGVLGGIGGAAVGGGLLNSAGLKMNAAGLWLGSGSAGVLGALTSFLAAGFLATVYPALKEATRDRPSAASGTSSDAEIAPRATGRRRRST